MGLDLGIERAGFEIRLACEVDRYCRETIVLNRPGIPLLGDINEYTPDEILNYAGLTRADDVDLIIGGPPCQSFSTVGKRGGLSDKRGNAFITYLETALAIRPRYIVIANVRGLLSASMKHRPHYMRGGSFPDLSLDELPGGALNFILGMIRKAGYSYSFNLYNAANFGTPQSRERVVLICGRGVTKPPYLTPTHSEGGKFGLKSWVTFREAVESIERHHHLDFPEKRLRYYRLLKAGENWRSLPDDLQREALGRAYFSGGGKTGFLRRLSWDRPSPTLVTHPAMPATDLGHPEEDRPLSINAVPVSLGYAIGTLIYTLLQGGSIKSYADFRYSRYRLTSEEDWEESFRERLRKREEN